MILIATCKFTAEKDLFQFLFLNNGQDATALSFPLVMLSE